MDTHCSASFYFWRLQNHMETLFDWPDASAVTVLQRTHVDDSHDFSCSACELLATDSTILILAFCVVGFVNVLITAGRVFAGNMYALRMACTGYIHGLVFETHQQEAGGFAPKNAYRTPKHKSPTALHRKRHVKRRNTRGRRLCTVKDTSNAETYTASNTPTYPPWFFRCMMLTFAPPLPTPRPTRSTSRIPF